MFQSFQSHIQAKIMKIAIFHSFLMTYSSLQLNQLFFRQFLYNTIIMINTKLKLMLRNSNPKLKLSFPKDPKADVAIYFKANVFYLQKPYLRIQSQYFKNNLLNQTSEIVISQDLDVIYTMIQQVAFKNILSLFYGDIIEIQRKSIQQYYKIINFLEIDILIQKIRKDIISNISFYNTFLILKMAETNEDQQLFQVCISQLQKQKFTQFSMFQQQLLSLHLGLFKLVIKAQNKFVVQNHLEFESDKIIHIIQKYCQSNNYDIDKFDQMIFQMLDLSSLKSHQFKQIFLSKKFSQVERKKNELRKNLSYNIQSRYSKQINSIIFCNQFYQNSQFSLNLKKGDMIQQLKLENMFLRKRVSEVQIQNKNLISQLHELFELTKKNESIQKQVQQDCRLFIKSFHNQIKNKKQKEKKYKQIINKCQKIISQLYEQLDQKSQIINLLLENIIQKQNLSPKYTQNNEKQQQEDFNINSQFLPASFVFQMMDDISPAKKTESLARQACLKLQNMIKKYQAIKKSYNLKNSSYRMHNSNSNVCSQDLINSLTAKIKQKKINQSSEKSLNDQQLELLCKNKICFNDEPITIKRTNIPKLAKLINKQSFQKKHLTLIWRNPSNSSEIQLKQNINLQKNILILIKTQNQQQICINISQFTQMVPQSGCQNRILLLFDLNDYKILQIKIKNEQINFFPSQKYFMTINQTIKIAKNCFQDYSTWNWYSQNEKVKKLSQQKFKIKFIQIYIGQNQSVEMVI